MSADPTTIIAAPVIMLIGKWLQPNGFTQNVRRTQGIGSRQDMILQSVRMITSHGPHDNAPDRRGQPSAGSPCRWPPTRDGVFGGAGLPTKPG
jgi:hypothetical protein